MITYILIVAVLIVGFLLITRRQKQAHSTIVNKVNNPFVKLQNKSIEKYSTVTMPSEAMNEDFIDAKFHIGYIDVINAFNDLAPNQRQIFNINNVPCKVSTEYDNKEVSEMLESFIASVNNDIKVNVPAVHSVNSGWDEQVLEPNVKSGWEKVQESLGLPSTLYQKPAVKTQVHLVSFGDVIVYETENEVKYVIKIVIAKEKITEKLVIKVAFVIVKGIVGKEARVLIENIDVLGYLTSQGLGLDRIELDNFYNFDSLEKNNMLDGKTIAGELMNKYDMRRRVMQERIDNSDQDVKDKYATSPSPASYDTYRMTTNIVDDMFVDPKYD